MKSGELNDKQIANVASLSDEVLSYLVKHPQAQDTMEGIAEWWLLEQRITVVVRNLEPVLHNLVESGFLLASKCEEGRFYYRLNRQMEREIRSHLRKSETTERLQSKRATSGK